MANKKEYQIVINGVSESIKSVDALTEKILNLEKTINNIKKSKIELPIEVGKSASDLSKTIQNVKGLTKAERDLMNAEQARNNALEAVNTELDGKNLQEYKEETKTMVAEMVKARNEAIGYANTLNGLKKELKDLNATKGDLDLGSSEYQEVSNRILELTNTLKGLEGAMGSHQRNVGNYSNSVVDAFGKIKLTINDTTYEFTGVNRAVQGLQKELQSMAAMGKQDTQEFKNLANALSELRENTHWTAQQIDELTKYETPIESLIGVFQGLGAALQVGEGISGMFGDNKEIEETTKKLVSLMSIMQGLQTVEKQLSTGEGLGAYFQKYNSAMDSVIDKLNIFKSSQNDIGETIEGSKGIIESVNGTFKSLGENIKAIPKNISKSISGFKNWIKSLTQLKASNVAATVSTNALSVAQKAGAVASNILSMALKAIPIMALVSGIIWLINNFDKLGKYIDEITGTSDTLGKVWNKITQVFSGVAEVIKSVVMPILKSYIDAVSKVLKGDFSGAAKSIADGYKKGFNEALNAKKNYEKGVSAEEKKQNEERIRQFATAKAKELKIEIEANNAKYGSDWKYTRDAQKLYKEYFENLRKSYAKDTDEYRDALNEEASYNRELTEKSKEQAKKARDIQDKINSLKIAAMRDGFQKELATIDENYRKELRDAENNAELKKQIEIKYQEDRLNLIKSYQKRYLDTIAANSEAEIRNSLENELSKNKLQQDKLDSDYASKTSTAYSAEGRNPSSKQYDVLENIRGFGNIENLFDKNLFTVEGGKDYLKGIKEVFAEENDIYVNSTKKLLDIDKKYYNDRFDLQKEALRASTELTLNEEDKKYKDTLEKLKKDFDEGVFLSMVDGSINNIEEREREAKKLYEEAIIKAEELSNERINIILNDEKIEEEKLVKEKLDNEQHAQSEYFANLLTMYSEYNNSVSQILSQSPKYNVFGVINYQKSKKELNAAKELITNTLSEIEGAKDKLNESFLNGEIDATQFEQLNTQYAKEKELVLKNAEEINIRSKSLFEDTARGYLDLANSYVSQISSLLNTLNATQMQLIENELAEVEHQLDIAQEAYEKAEALAQEHADKINTIEDELSTARGDRRQFLIDALVAQRQAYEEDLIAKQEAEEAKARLEEKQKKLEKKRAEQDKKQKVQQAIINTFTAISNALSVQPWFVGAALAATAGVLGWKNVNAIKATPIYEDGGVIQGARHSQGGVKVLGGQAEVEGGEFITNRKSTRANLGLLEFINDKKYTLNENDLMLYFNGKAHNKFHNFTRRFAEGGQLPTATGQNVSQVQQVENIIQDNATYVVSVVDIANAQDRLNKVKVLSGIED